MEVVREDATRRLGRGRDAIGFNLRRNRQPVSDVIFRSETVTVENLHGDRSRTC